MFNFDKLKIIWNHILNVEFIWNILIWYIDYDADCILNIQYHDFITPKDAQRKVTLWHKILKFQTHYLESFICACFVTIMLIKCLHGMVFY